MEYRYIGNTKVSLLGYGAMRLPTDADGIIDREKSAALLEKAYKSGVNYFDTAHPYMNFQSEPFVGEVMSRFPRESYCLATKMSAWLLEKPEDTDRIFKKQLENLRTDYIDFYLLHALDSEKWKKLLDFGVVEYFEEKLKSGVIRKLGFSFHDEFDVFREIVTYRKWDFCQLQLNYMDMETQAGEKGLRLADELGIPVVVMEPVKGGTLAALPEEAKRIFRDTDSGRSDASWALRWIASQKNISVVLSGMSNMEQVNDNLQSLGEFVPTDDRENAAVCAARDAIRARTKVPCTGCGYCQPCPAGVKIPAVFRVWNNYGMYGDSGDSAWRWRGIKPEERPDNCMECGSCESACPQKIDIRDMLKAAEAELKKYDEVSGK